MGNASSDSSEYLQAVFRSCSNVSFKGKAMRCRRFTDMKCVVCDRWFCENCCFVCVQCEQVVCKSCYQQDECCTSPGKTTENFKQFYENKFIESDGVVRITVFLRGHDSHNVFRRDVLRRSVGRFLSEGEFMTKLPFAFVVIAKNFPLIAHLSEYKDDVSELVEELIENNIDLASAVLVFSDDRDQFLSIVLKSDDLWKKVSQKGWFWSYVMGTKEGEDIFIRLQQEDLLDASHIPLFLKSTTDAVFSHAVPILHLKGFKWYEQNGLDVLNNKRHFVTFVSLKCVEIIEYLFMEKQMTMEYFLSHNVALDFRMVELILRMGGISALQNISCKNFDFCSLKTLKCLKINGYKFDQERIGKSVRALPLYHLVCLDILKFEQLDNSQQQTLLEYVAEHDVKVCRAMFPFMKPLR